MMPKKADLITREQFAKALVRRMDLRPTRRRVIAVVAWSQAEDTLARFNPLATTKDMKGATNFNPVGVKNYLSFDQGLEATYLTLLLPYYDKVRHNFKWRSARAILRAVGNSPWAGASESYGSLLQAVLGSVEADYETYAGKPIGQ